MPIIISLLIVFFLAEPRAGAQEAAGAKVPPAWERPDILGRPIPWGKEVRGQRVCLWMPTTRLLYGQPIVVHLETAQRSDQPPYIRLEWDGLRRSIYLEWTTDRGEAVTFTRWHDGAGTHLGNPTSLYLQPTGKFARGHYVVPGKYRMRVVIDSRRVPADPLRWIGRAESNALEFTVFESDDRGRGHLVRDELRAPAARLVSALDDQRFDRREAAERELFKCGFEILPLLEPALDSRSDEARRRARRILGALTAPLFGDRLPNRTSGIDEAAALLAPLSDTFWKALRQELPASHEEHLRNLRVDAALVGPVPWTGEADQRPADAVRKLVADLNSEEPHVRAVAVRSVPPTSNGELLAALVARLSDSHKVYRVSIGDPAPVHPIADEAGLHAIPRQGQAIIEPLLAFARKENDAWVRWRIFKALGMLGPDPRSLEFVRASIAAADPNELFVAVQTLAKLGPDAVPDLIKLAEAGKQEGQNPNIPQIAVEQLAHHGKAQTVGPFLMKMLRQRDWAMVAAAIPFVEKVKSREALPELKRLAQDDTTEQNAQAWAIAAYARMAERKDAAVLLMERLDSTKPSARGMAAFQLAAIEWREAVPRILESLSDKDWYVRAQADQALRGLAERPEGVGYNAYDPNPSLWRDWWKKR